MEILAAVVVMQLVASCLGFGMMWKKLEDLKAQLDHMHDARTARDSVREKSTWRAQEARQPELFALLADTAPTHLPPSDPSLSDDPFSDAWVRPDARGAAKPARREPPLVAVDHVVERPWRREETLPSIITQDRLRAVLAAMALSVPAIGLPFGSNIIALVVTGLLAAAATLLLALRRDWQAPSWIAAFAAAVWALIGIQTGAAASDPVLFSLALTATASAGLVQAGLQRRVWSGASMALLMGAAAIAFCARTSFLTPQGLAFFAIVAGAAALGASRLRRDALHVAAFALAGVGLVVHSGQQDAAIWFTPMAAWIAALFFGIAAVRAPALGARGALLAATGAIAPLFAAGALTVSHHADAWTSAGVFVVIAALFGGVFALAGRRAGSVGALKLTAWLLTAATTFAVGAAFVIALPAALAAPAFAALACGLLGADRRWAHPLWRFFATLTAAGAAIFACAALVGIGGAHEVLGPLGQILLGVAAPAALLGGAAWTARRAPVTTGALETAAIALALASFSALIRVLFAGGAPALQPISFAEAGFHQAIWLGASLSLAARAPRGAADVRRAFAFVLAAAAAITCVIAAPLWLTQYWNVRAETAVDWAILRTAALGFALPALAAWAHWVYWRAQQAPQRTRAALGLAGYLTAALISFEMALQRPAMVGIDWLLLAASALVFALAAGAQFVPGAIVEPDAPVALDLDEYLKRDRRRQQAG